MDTGDLSVEIHQAIMIESEMFNHDLTLQFELLSGNCIDKNKFIEKSIRLINEMKKYNNIDLDNIFFGNPPKKSEFQNILKKLLANIAEVKKIPTKKRTYD